MKRDRSLTLERNINSPDKVYISHVKDEKSSDPLSEAVYSKDINAIKDILKNNNNVDIKQIQNLCIEMSNDNEVNAEQMSINNTILLELVRFRGFGRNTIPSFAVNNELSPYQKLALVKSFLDTGTAPVLPNESNQLTAAIPELIKDYVKEQKNKILEKYQKHFDGKQAAWEKLENEPKPPRPASLGTWHFYRGSKNKYSNDNPNTKFYKDDNKNKNEKFVCTDIVQCAIEKFNKSVQNGENPHGNFKEFLRDIGIEEKAEILLQQSGFDNLRERSKNMLHQQSNISFSYSNFGKLVYTLFESIQAKESAVFPLHVLGFYEEYSGHDMMLYLRRENDMLTIGIFDPNMANMFHCKMLPHDDLSTLTIEELGREYNKTGSTMAIGGLSHEFFQNHLDAFKGNSLSEFVESLAYAIFLNNISYLDHINEIIQNEGKLQDLIELERKDLTEKIKNKMQELQNSNNEEDKNSTLSLQKRTKNLTLSPKECLAENIINNEKIIEGIYAAAFFSENLESLQKLQIVLKTANITKLPLSFDNQIHQNYFKNAILSAAYRKDIELIKNFFALFGLTDKKTITLFLIRCISSMLNFNGKNGESRDIYNFSKIMESVVTIITEMDKEAGLESIKTTLKSIDKMDFSDFLWEPRGSSYFDMVLSEKVFKEEDQKTASETVSALFDLLSMMKNNKMLGFEKALLRLKNKYLLNKKIFDGLFKFDPKLLSKYNLIINGQDKK
jgi:hypothetical protein